MVYIVNREQVQEPLLMRDAKSTKVRCERRVGEDDAQAPRRSRRKVLSLLTVVLPRL